MSIIEKGKNSIKQLAEKGALHILVGNFATKFVAFFGSMFLSRILDKTELGVLSYMENLTGYAVVFMGLGLSNAILRFVVLSESKEKKLAYFNYVARKSWIIDIIIVGAVLGINIFYPHKEGFALAKTLLPVYILSIPFQDKINQSQMNERASFDNKRFAIVSVGSAAALVIARVISAKIGGLNAVVYGVVLANLLLGIGLPLLTRKKHYSGVNQVQLTKEEKKEASTYSFQYMITNGLWSIFMLADVYLLGALLSDPTVLADYKIAYAFPANMSIFSSAIGIFIAPYFVKNENNKEWIRENYKKTLLISIVVFGLVGAGLFVLAKPLIWLFGKKYLNVVPLMRLLIVSGLVENVLRYPIANILAAIGKVKYNMMVAAGGFVIRVILNIIFIPKYMGYAVAGNAIVSQLLMSIVLFYFFNRLYGIVGKGKE